MFVSSENIEVFPVAKQRHKNSKQTNGGRLFTEQYVSNIIRQLIGTSGFIINYNTPSSGSAEFNTDVDLTVEFNLRGYYFNIKNLHIKSIIEYYKDVDTRLYTTISKMFYVFAKIEGFDSCGEISGQDEKEGKTVTYKGLSLGITTDVNELDENSLVLFDLKPTVVDGAKLSDGADKFTFVAHLQSYQKFSPQSVHITGIDGTHA